MPFQFSSTTWWLLLGIFVGFVIFWLIDKLFRRDGEFAAERERREIKSLQEQLTEDRTEHSDAQKKLVHRISETKRLTKLSEGLRDTVREQDQKIINLEAALAAAREQQVKDEPVRDELVTLLGEHEELSRKLEEESRNSASLNEKVQVSFQTITDRDEQIRALEDKLRNTREEMETLANHHQSIPTGSPQVTSIATAAGAAVVSTRPTRGTPDTEQRPIKQPPAFSNKSVTDRVPPSSDAQHVGHPAGQEDSTNQKPTDKANENLDAVASQAVSSLASRHGGASVPAVTAESPQSVKSGLLKRLRGAFTSRPPDDLA